MFKKIPFLIKFVSSYEWPGLKKLFDIFHNNISNLRSFLHKSNYNINYYIIKINIPNFSNIFNRLNISHIEYREENSYKWISKSRILNNIGEPINSH